MRQTIEIIIQNNSLASELNLIFFKLFINPKKFIKN